MRLICCAIMCAAFMAAFFMPGAQGHDLPCFKPEQADLLQPRDTLRGYGLTTEGLIKLSVTATGAFLITFSPPKTDGMVCLVWMGQGWEIVTPRGEEARLHD